MALIDLTDVGGVWWPFWITAGSNLSATSNVTQNGTNVAYAVQWQVARTGTIDAVTIRFGTVTTGGTLEARFVTNTSGTPTDTVVATGANGFATLTTGDANGFLTFTLTTPLAVTAGEILTLAIYNDTGTPGTYNLLRCNAANPGRQPKFYNRSTGWGDNSIGNPFAGALHYTDGYHYDPAFLPVAPALGATDNTYSTTVETGFKFTLPFGGVLQGFAMGKNGNQAANEPMTLYDASGNVLASHTSTNTEGITNVGNQALWRFAAPATLAANTVYRLGFRTSSGTATLNYISLPNTDLLKALPLQDRFCRTQRTYSGGAGVWTDDALDVPSVSLLFSQIAYPDAVLNPRVLPTNWRGR